MMPTTLRPPPDVLSHGRTADPQRLGDQPLALPRRRTSGGEPRRPLRIGNLTAGIGPLLGANLPRSDRQWARFASSIGMATFDRKRRALLRNECRIGVPGRANAPVASRFYATRMGCRFLGFCAEGPRLTARMSGLARPRSTGTPWRPCRPPGKCCAYRRRWGFSRRP